MLVQTHYPTAIINQRLTAILLTCLTSAVSGIPKVLSAMQKKKLLFALQPVAPTLHCPEGSYRGV